MNQSLCPACNSLINDSSTNVCPCCGLKNLNQMFVNQAAQNAWKAAELEPFVKELIPKIFVGRDNALFLTYNGELYGVGKNDKHQLSFGDELWFDFPVNLAHGVKNAAAGLDYVIWVDKVGSVHLKGSGEYSDLFKGFDSVVKVLADPFENIFWLIKNQDEVYVFGNNFNGILFPLMEEKIFIGKSIAVVKFEEHLRVQGTGGNETYYTNNEDSTEQEVKHIFEGIYDYKELLKKHGRINVELSINEIKEKRELVSGESLTAQKRTERRLYRGDAILRNLQLTQPIKTRLTESRIKIPIRKHISDNESDLDWLEQVKNNVKEKGHFQSVKVDDDLSYEVVEVYGYEGGKIYVMLTRDHKILLASTEDYKRKKVRLYEIDNGIPKFMGHTSFYIF